MIRFLKASTMTLPRLRERLRLLIATVLLLLSLGALLAACGREPEEEFLFAADAPPVTISYVARM